MWLEFPMEPTFQSSLSSLISYSQEYLNQPAHFFIPITRQRMRMNKKMERELDERAINPNSNQRTINT